MIAGLLRFFKPRSKKGIRMDAIIQNGFGILKDGRDGIIEKDGYKFNISNLSQFIRGQDTFQRIEAILPPPLVADIIITNHNGKPIGLKAFRTSMNMYDAFILSSHSLRQRTVVCITTGTFWGAKFGLLYKKCIPASLPARNSYLSYSIAGKEKYCISK